MCKAEESILKPAIIEAKIIPHGIDLSTFHPVKKDRARAMLDLPQDAKILLFAANGIRKNPFKDYLTISNAICLIAEKFKGTSIIFIALGEEESSERIGQAEVRFVPYQKDPKVVADYYQIADLYIHAARADSFPNSILEALACGVPVVATAVGGIPEQIKGLRDKNGTISFLNHYEIDEATGMLVSAGDAEGMAISITGLLSDATLRSRLGENAAKDAQKRFDLGHQVNEYLNWYCSILGVSSTAGIRKGNDQSSQSVQNPAVRPTFSKFGVG